MTLYLPQAVRSERILKFHYSSKTFIFACIFLFWYRDLNFADKFSSGDQVYIGEQVYVDISFNIDGIGQKINFFIDECQVKVEESEVKIIADNCYSETAKGLTMF